jgi:hypothetical protein
VRPSGCCLFFETGKAEKVDGSTAHWVSVNRLVELSGRAMQDAQLPGLAVRCKQTACGSLVKG